MCNSTFSRSMIKNISFATRARTIDHLGREQIADCPTAISELWKNAYDAYARNVELHIFDGKEPVAAIYDDGHGMNYEEFVGKWLVVGTEAKFENSTIPDEDRLGLEPRLRQGHKGIGRLSAANLGPVLLVVSKRKKHDFIAALLDWRIFENPFINLNDIQVPVTQFSNKKDLLNTLPDLFERLHGNIDGNQGDEERKSRLDLAWRAHDQLFKDSSDNYNLFKDVSDSHNQLPPSLAIKESAAAAAFSERHFQQWKVWSDDSDTGTAMLISGINDDLRAHWSTEEGADPSEKYVKELFVQTLSGFVDPLIDPDASEENAKPVNFDYAVKVWNGEGFRLVVSADRGYDRLKTKKMEHVLEGRIDRNGVFRGQVKAFGHWQKTGDNYEIRPPKDLKMPSRTYLGPVDLYITSYEQQRQNSSHSDAEFENFTELAKKYSGLMIYRNGLRVLPYGREDNDFFRIEMRRSFRAGTEFWNARRMFGRIAISTQNNPHLKDKAGREGFIDNAAAKALRQIITHVLKESARDYFGSRSEIRTPNLKKNQRRYAKEKAEKEYEKLQKRQRKQFRSALREGRKPLLLLIQKVEAFEHSMDLSTEKGIEGVKIKVEDLRHELGARRLPNPPAKLGILEGEYREFQSEMTRISQLLNNLDDQISVAMESFQANKAEQFLAKQIERLTSKYVLKVNSWGKRIHALQKGEQERFKTVLGGAGDAIDRELGLVMTNYKNKKISFTKASMGIDGVFSHLMEEKEQMFKGYIEVLENLSESIDVQIIAQYGDALRTEVDRLNGLAQVGIAVEILGHELQSYDDMIADGLKRLPKEIQDTTAAESIRTGYEGLANQLRFLSPLKVSGMRVKENITGKKIADYIQKFFSGIFINNKIIFDPTEEFLQFSVFEEPSRILPVFLNLVNNSVYWLSTPKQKHATIRLSVQGETVLVSDNGPGVDEIDEDDLFSLFFTRKTSGGRGVGLYLCKANLRAGGHTIEYLGANSKIKKPLDGANFAIHFAGGKYASTST